MFGAVKLTKNADIDKYKYSPYGIGFDRNGTFQVPSGGLIQKIPHHGNLKDYLAKLLCLILHLIIVFLH